MLREQDYTQQLANYIKKNLTKGYTLDSLKIALTNQGYSKSGIETAIKIVNKQLAEAAPKMEEKPVIRYEVITDEKIKEESRKGFWGKIKGWFK